MYKQLMALTTDQIREIESKASDVLSLVYDGEGLKPPIDLSKILQKSGLTLKAGEFEDDNVSGYYDKNKKTVYVAKDDSYARKIFTIAHELGHFFLHKHKESEIFYRLNAVELDKEEKADEQAANWFAACLLMPQELLKNYWGFTHDLKELAAVFGVSQTAMLWRLKNLGLIITQDA